MMKNIFLFLVVASAAPWQLGSRSLIARTNKFPPMIIDGRAYQVRMANEASRPITFSNDRDKPSRSNSPPQERDRPSRSKSPPQGRGKRSRSNSPPQERGKRSRSDRPDKEKGKRQKSNSPPQGGGRRSRSSSPPNERNLQQPVIDIPDLPEAEVEAIGSPGSKIAVSTPADRGHHIRHYEVPLGGQNRPLAVGHPAAASSAAQVTHEGGQAILRAKASGGIISTVITGPQASACTICTSPGQARASVTNVGPNSNIRQEHPNNNSGGQTIVSSSLYGPGRITLAAQQHML